MNKPNKVYNRRDIYMYTYPDNICLSKDNVTSGFVWSGSNQLVQTFQELDIYVCIVCVCMYACIVVVLITKHVDIYACVWVY